MNKYEVYLGRIKEVGSNYVYCIESVCDLLNSYSKKMQENKKLSDDDTKFTTPPVVFVLEDKIKHLQSQLEQKDKIIAELKKCVEFYAKLENYTELHDYKGLHNFEIIGSNPIQDRGDKARETIKRVEGLKDE